MNLRRIVFWPHLVAGVLAGLVILIMSVTGVLLTYERQILAWSDRGYRSTAPTRSAAPLSIEAVAAALRTSEPSLHPTGFVVRADPAAPITVNAGPRTLFVDRYSGALLGESSRGGVRGAMSTIRGWHRWLAVDGDNRAITRAITGWSNALLFLMVISGLYLWFPRQWTRRQFRSVGWFNRGLSGKARDFNWHNVVGAWSAIPLFVIVACALPMSFPWANALIYGAVGDTPPVQGGGREGGREGGRDGAPGPRRTAGARAPGEASDARRGADEAPPSFDGIDALWTRAERQVPAWRSISLRLPGSPLAPVVFTIDRGNGGQPQLRSALTLDRRTAAVVSYEAFSDLTPGRRIRNVMRFAHTGEVLGLPGQTVAGLVSAGGAVLVWTGLALAWRRLRAWMKRRSERTTTVSIPSRTTATLDHMTKELR